MIDDEAVGIIDHASRMSPELDAQLSDSIAMLQVSDDVEETMLRITTLACQVIDGCSFCSVSERHGDTIQTRGATDERAEAIDRIQKETREGPCWVAATERQRLVYTPNVGEDARWPTFSRRTADEVGVYSLLACRLVTAEPPRALGAINVYGGEPGCLDAADHQVAMLLAAVAGVLLDAAQREAQLTAAIESRGLIGQALGILMAQSDVTSDEAFDQLRSASQRMNIKLRDLAQTIAASTGKPRER